jgi:tetratricopeptide (TPR) repeat protein
MSDDSLANILMIEAEQLLEMYNEDQSQENLLNNAIQGSKRAVQITRANHVTGLSLLATCLYHRIQKRFSLDDFDQALEAVQEMSSLAHDDPESQLEASQLLTKLYKQRFDALGELSDLDAAIAFGQTCANSIAIEPSQRLIHLINLSTLQSDRFELLRRADDAESAVDSARQAEELASGMNPAEQASAAAAVGAALLRLCLAGRQLDGVDQLNTAIEKNQ